MTFGQLRQNVAKLVTVLKGSGIKEGDRVVGIKSFTITGFSIIMSLLGVNEYTAPFFSYFLG